MSDEKKANSYRDLIVWQKGMALVKRIYQITATFPVDERFGLVSQMRRAAVSIPSNIAEGQARHTTGEFIQFVSHAEGSVAELDTQLILAIELGFCPKSEVGDVFRLIIELQKMLNALRRQLATRH
jgi:four helix bundle protein